jgi:hypothetical protein
MPAPAPPTSNGQKTACVLVDTNGNVIDTDNPLSVALNGGATVNALNSVVVALEADPGILQTPDSAILAGTTDSTFPSTGGTGVIKPVRIGQGTMAQSVSVAVATNQTAVPVSIGGTNADAFSRIRVSAPQGLFDAQFTYDLQPLLFEQVITGSGASIGRDATNNQALMTFASTPTGGKAFMQSFEYIPYQPGRSQQAFVTFNMLGGVANVLKFAGLCDGTEGIQFQLEGTTPQLAILTAGTAGAETVSQASWNIDPMTGSGPSGVTLDFSKTQILAIDLQALYVGRVRCGFDVDGILYPVHEFKHANIFAYPYFRSANLPVRCGMTCTGTVSTTMNFICSSVISEGGQDENRGYRFSTIGTATAGNNTRIHALSLRPLATFNSQPYRAKFVLEDIDVLVTGSNPVYWELVLGQALTTPTAASANAAYSGFEQLTGGTLSGNPLLVIDSGFVASTNQSKSAANTRVPLRYPITLDAAGAQRTAGQIGVLVTGLGSTSACQVSMSWKEIR